MIILLIVFLGYLFDLILIIGTSYLVFWKGHSGAWFLLTLVLIGEYPYSYKKRGKINYE